MSAPPQIRRPLRGVPIALAFPLALLGCHAVFSYEATRSADARLADRGGHDGGPRDRAAGEHPGSADARTDDGTPADQRATDLGVADQQLGPDAAPAGACAPTATEVSWRPDMVLCQLPDAQKTDQCDAARHCGVGWHLCTATEYLGRGGRTSSPPGGQFDHHWLAACVRVGDTLSPPDNDAICPGSCVNVPGAQLAVSWPCATAGWSYSVNSPLGIVTHTSCQLVGVNDAAWAGFWITQPASAAVDGAACCK